MKFLVVVNESPWGSGLALAACRFVQAAIDSGIHIKAVFFREEGVYNALSGEATDALTPDLTAAWVELGSTASVRLLLCRSSRLRRIPATKISPFEDSGLTEMIELMLESDRVVTF